MRVFLAITPPDAIKASLLSAIQRLTPIAANVTWCTRERLHMTMAFLGDTASAILPHITTAVERVCATHAPFTCQAYGFGFFGIKRNPTSLWAGINLDTNLETLNDELWQALKTFGYENAEISFRPHITLGRCHSAPRNRAVVDAMAEDSEIDFGQWIVTHVSILESRPTPRGPIYRTIANVPLQPPA